MRRAPGWQGAPDGQQAKNSCYKMFILPVNAALPIADGLPTLVVTHQLQVERRTGKVRRPETDVLSLYVPRHQHSE